MEIKRKRVADIKRDILLGLIPDPFKKKMSFEEENNKVCNLLFHYFFESHEGSNDFYTWVILLTSFWQLNYILTDKEPKNRSSIYCKETVTKGDFMFRVIRRKST